MLISLTRLAPSHTLTKLSMFIQNTFT